MRKVLREIRTMPPVILPVWLSGMPLFPQLSGSSKSLQLTRVSQSSPSPRKHTNGIFHHVPSIPAGFRRTASEPLPRSLCTIPPASIPVQPKFGQAFLDLALGDPERNISDSRPGETRPLFTTPGLVSSLPRDQKPQPRRCYHLSFRLRTSPQHKNGLAPSNCVHSS